MTHEEFTTYLNRMKYLFEGATAKFALSPADKAEQEKVAAMRAATGNESIPDTEAFTQYQVTMLKWYTVLGPYPYSVVWAATLEYSTHAKTPWLPQPAEIAEIIEKHAKEKADALLPYVRFAKSLGDNYEFAYSCLLPSIQKQFVNVENYKRIARADKSNQHKLILQLVTQDTKAIGTSGKHKEITQ